MYVNPFFGVCKKKNENRTTRVDVLFGGAKMWRAAKFRPETVIFHVQNMRKYHELQLKNVNSWVCVDTFLVILMENSFFIWFFIADSFWLRNVLHELHYMYDVM